MQSVLQLIARSGRAAAVALGLAAVLLISGCAGKHDGLLGTVFDRPETSVAYDVVLEGSPGSEVTSLAEQSLSVYRLRDKGAPSLAFLRRRAESDLPLLLKLLRSQGYYSGTATVDIEEVAKDEAAAEKAPEANSPAGKAPEAQATEAQATEAQATEAQATEAQATEAQATEAKATEAKATGAKATGAKATEAQADREPTRARVILTIDAGEPYTLTRHTLRVEQTGAVAPPALDAAALGSPVGAQARAAAIAAAEGAGVLTLQREGFPYAEFTSRSGLADPSAATLEVDSDIAAGPGYVFGPVSFEGLKQVDEDYLRTYVPWKEGATFNNSELTAFQRALFGTDLFRALTVGIPDAPPADGTQPAPLPVTVKAEEGPRRRISGSLRYSSDLGPAVRASFEHRNLFGANERLLLQAEVALLEQSVGIGLRKPQFLRPGQELVTDLTFTRSTLDAYDAETVTGFAGIERQITPRWRVGIGGLGEGSRINDSGVNTKDILLGIPTFAAYDGSNNLFDPTKGARLRIEATPFAGVQDGSNTEFFVLDNKGSAYLPLDSERRYVIATRGRLATILAPDLASVPATRRLYSGGGTSVRGYREDLIGPLDSKNNPIGGRSAVEAGVEFRARLFGDIGGVVFTEAGSVSTEMFPDFANGVQTAAGLGLRYYSPAGPIRLDVAVPLNRRSADDRFQVYFSIGQAF